MKYARTLPLLLLLSACRTSAPQAALAPPADAMPFESVLEGYQSGLHARGAQLISNEEQWAAFWKAHSNWRIPAPPAPAIDFATHSALAVSLGDKPSAGWAVELRWLALRNGHLVVHAAQRAPAKDAIVPQVVTQPYAIVAIPRTEAPVVELELE